jgi:hypothetical protein
VAPVWTVAWAVATFRRLARRRKDAPRSTQGFNTVPSNGSECSPDSQMIAGTGSAVPLRAAARSTSYWSA